MDAAFAQRVFLFCIGMMPIAFFRGFRLYDYHLIYAAPYHLLGMCKAFLLSLMTGAILLAFYSGPVSIPQNWLLPAVAALVMGSLVVGRLLWDHFIALLKPVGLACIVVGTAELIQFREGPLIFSNAPAFLGAVILTMASLLASRFAIVHIVFNRTLRRRFRRQVLLIGRNSDAERITDQIIRHKAPFWIAGTVSHCEECRLNTVVPKGSLGRLQDLESIVGEHFFQEAIITDELIDKAELVNLLDLFTSRGMTVWFLPKLMPIIDVKLDIDNLCGTPLVRLQGGRDRWLFQKAKYAFDALAGLAGALLVLPLFCAAALAIVLDSKGPVFYRPRAIGKNGRVFTMFKFRSMHADAGSRIHQDYVTKLIKGEIRQDGSGKPLKIVDDPRVTRVGRLLRKTSLDELPQLINVLKGEMSLVGPRPCLPYEWELYNEWQKKRSAVRPGITGLWQVVGRSEVSFEEMILLDLYYIYNRSFELDFSILFETLFVVLKKKGAH
ncbi:MAG: exopolysaccharide biosynthesis polyprenyl glycosylphosphotransferase [Desulfobacterales bacterium]|nr:exopolysaccharide biosynthesis polyprenyl glycosylphosphotransferase [Desulfobacterales bacterium]